MRNMNEIAETINNWEGTFAELVDEFSIGEYHTLFEEGWLEYIDGEWVEENCYNTGDYAGI